MTACSISESRPSDVATRRPRCAESDGRSVVAGSDARINALYTTHVPALRRFLHRLTAGESHKVDDLIQETMIRAWRCLESVPSTEVEMRRWLYVVARRLVIDESRARWSRHEITGIHIEGQASGDVTSDTALASHLLVQAFGRLTPSHRDILTELHLRGRSIDETAERLKVPVGTVKSRAHYAMVALRAAFE